MRVDPGARVRQVEPVAAELAQLRPLRVSGGLVAQQPDTLDVPALLRLRRALATTTPGARGDAIEARKCEIDRLLGVEVRDYGILRACVRQVDNWVTSLGCGDVQGLERKHLAKVCVAAWRKGVQITNRIMGLSQYEPARQHALEAYRALTRCSLERVIATRSPGIGMPRDLISFERELWRRAYFLVKDAGEEWPDACDEEAAQAKACEVRAALARIAAKREPAAEPAAEPASAPAPEPAP
jgi:hypothetical protein